MPNYPNYSTIQSCNLQSPFHVTIRSAQKQKQYLLCFFSIFFQTIGFVYFFKKGQQKSAALLFHHINDVWVYSMWLHQCSCIQDCHISSSTVTQQLVLQLSPVFVLYFYTFSVYRLDMKCACICACMHDKAYFFQLARKALFEYSYISFKHHWHSSLEASAVTNLKKKKRKRALK